MAFQIIAYLKFLLKSTNQHGVHSPFVFQLITKCFYDRNTYKAYDVLQKYRHLLLANQNSIEVTDFGAGSRVFKSNHRKVSAIAKNAGITPKYAKLLYRLTDYFQPKNILEIGTSLGIATAAIAEGTSTANITTLEGCRQTAGIASDMIRRFQFSNVDLVAAEFGTYIDAIPLNAEFDLIYFDGNHTKAATLSYFSKLLRTINNDSCWIFDDIHWSAEMEAAWSEIKSHPQVTVTIDTFQWGIVFFRKQQEKEHFIIRV